MWPRPSITPKSWSIRGLPERVGPEAWRDIVAGLIEAIKAGNPASGLHEAITQVGAILAVHSPARFDDTDELPNKVIVL